MTKRDANLVNPVDRLRNAPRCHARAKSTGERCKCPAVNGWSVCRVHGARGGHVAGPGHPQWRHGDGRVRLLRLGSCLACSGALVSEYPRRCRHPAA
jgi:hypothetical protein